jgi:hypothetical protein
VYVDNIDAIYPALLVSVASLILVSLITSPTHTAAKA